MDYKNIALDWRKFYFYCCVTKIFETDNNSVKFETFTTL